MVASSEPRSDARGGADILDLDRYMRGSRPARRPTHTNGSGLVVDGGATGRPSSSASSDSEPSDKQYSHDSGLSDTSYRHQRPNRNNRVVTSTGSNSDTVERRRVKKSSGVTIDRRRASGEPRGKASGEIQRRRKSKGDARHSESNRSFRETLERALRDQQAQIARVAAMCERQRSERTSERQSDKPSERRSRRAPLESAERTTSGSTDLSSSSTSMDPVKRRTSECRTYKIIMSKLDELNRLFAARRVPPAPAPARAPPRAPQGDSSVTVSDKVVGTESQQHTGRQAKQRATSVVAAGAVDIPPRHNVITESVVRNEDREISEPASEKAMPGRFHLDDPVRLYQQAKRLEARERRGSSSPSSGSPSGSGGSALGSGGSGGSALGSGAAKGSPSLCALCRCYWSVARRYVAAQLNAVRE